MARAVLATALALVTLAAATAFADAELTGKRTELASVAAKLRPGAVVRLNRHGKIPLAALPKVRGARNADRLAGRRASSYLDRCSPDTVELGTVCMMTNPYPLDNREVGRNDYFFATQRCTELGGYLPTAAQLIGAAERVKLASTIGDAQLTASIDLDPSDGLKDRREMSATLVTTAAGSRAAGSQGVSEGSRGDPRAGEPDPVPQPANPVPETLQYVTVYDNGDKGGFAGSKPVGQPELFRCAFNRAQGDAGELG
jgi:hypothetical protein